QRQMLLRAFGRWHPPIRAVLEATDDTAIVATDILEVAPPRRWSVGRVTLLGDAAHPSTPNLGQGACQAFEDAAVLGRALREHAHVPTALRAYEAQRVRRANAMTAQARWMGRMGQWRGGLACWLRDQMILRTPAPLGRRNLRWMFDFDSAPLAAPGEAVGRAVAGAAGEDSNAREAVSAAVWEYRE